MSDQPVLIHVPDTLYERIQQIAEDSHRSVETVLLESLDILFADVNLSPNDMSELQAYSDEQLWAVVHRRLPWTQSLRLQELNAKARSSELSDPEEMNLKKLLEITDLQMLLRSEALRLLKERGYDVDHYFTPSV